MTQLKHIDAQETHILSQQAQVVELQHRVERFEAAAIKMRSLVLDAKSRP